MKPVYLIGSAPYAPEWWKQHKDQVEIAHCINNAKAIVGDHQGTWYFSTDFLIHNNYCFKALQERSGQDWHFCTMVSDCLMQPRGYECEYEGTMVLNACYDILNRAILKGECLELNLVGCDMDYSGPQTHFYEGGTADPMRIPQEVLVRHLNRLNKAYTGFHIIKTLGPPSILPFESGNPDMQWKPAS